MNPTNAYIIIAPIKNQKKKGKKQEREKEKRKAKNDSNIQHSTRRAEEQ